uniref:Uncharacterized protein n=1 Tax=Romanomermis culicivorax TaxID=13658 RepID=A0A915L8W0_ROMCU
MRVEIYRLCHRQCCQAQMAPVKTPCRDSSQYECGHVVRDGRLLFSARGVVVISEILIQCERSVRSTDMHGHDDADTKAAEKRDSEDRPSCDSQWRLCLRGTLSQRRGRRRQRGGVRLSDCKNDVVRLLKKRRAAGKRSVSLETSSAHMAETVAFSVHFSGKKPIRRANSYSGGDMSIFQITRYASK